MINRYTHKEMGDIWTEENMYKTWLEVELAVCKAWVELGELPQKTYNEIYDKANFDANRIEEIEKDVKHDVIAFLTNVSEYVGPENSRFIHKGLTSSDILDTSLAMRMNQSISIIVSKIRALMEAVKKRAYQYKDTIIMGRSHGMHAEPTTFGLKLASWYAEIERSLQRIYSVWESICCGKISGAVGTYAHIPMELEVFTLDILGLECPKISNQILQRDRHAECITALAIVGASLEKFATEIRHLARTEIHEVEEPFTKNQKGSSAMPQKRNPIRSENVCGCARVLRGYALTAMENVAL